MSSTSQNPCPDFTRYYRFRPRTDSSCSTTALILLVAANQIWSYDFGLLNTKSIQTILLIVPDNPTQMDFHDWPKSPLILPPEWLAHLLELSTPAAGYEQKFHTKSDVKEENQESVYRDCF